MPSWPDSYSETAPSTQRARSTDAGSSISKCPLLPSRGVRSQQGCTASSVRSLGTRRRRRCHGRPRARRGRCRPVLASRQARRPRSGQGCRSATPRSDPRAWCRSRCPSAAGTRPRALTCTCTSARTSGRSSGVRGVLLASSMPLAMSSLVVGESVQGAQEHRGRQGAAGHSKTDRGHGEFLGVS